MALSNPFRPGFASRPEVLGGREDVLENGAAMYVEAADDRHTPMPIILVGPRGVGKTVLMEVIAQNGGASHGWPVLAVEATPGTSLSSVIDLEARRVQQAIDEMPSRPRLSLHEAVLQAKVAGIGGELRFSRRAATSAERSVEHLVGSLGERGSGLTLLVDEAQSAPPGEFAELAALLQRAVRTDAPMVTLIGGLPGLRRRPAGSAESLGYLERASWHHLGSLHRDATRYVFQETARRAGRSMAAVAADRLAEASGGYPYAIQVLGRHVWRASDGFEVITAGHAEAAIPTAERELTRTLYEGRWQQTAPGERRYLAALAEIDEAGHPTTSRAIADRLGRTTNQMAPIRARLLERGTITPDGRELRLMVPGFSTWIRSHTDPGHPGQIDR